MQIQCMTPGVLREYCAFCNARNAPISRNGISCMDVPTAWHSPQWHSARSTPSCQILHHLHSAHGDRIHIRKVVTSLRTTEYYAIIWLSHCHRSYMLPLLYIIVDATLDYTHRILRAPAAIKDVTYHIPADSKSQLRRYSSRVITSGCSRRHSTAVVIEQQQ